MAVVALAVLTIGRSAFAASPFCDDRAATMLAPDPILYAPDIVISRAEPCRVLGGRLLWASVRPASELSGRVFHGVEPIVVGSRTYLAPPIGEARRAPPEDAVVPGGVFVRVERPPRG